MDLNYGIYLLFPFHFVTTYVSPQTHLNCKTSTVCQLISVGLEARRKFRHLASFFGFHFQVVLSMGLSPDVYTSHLASKV